MIKIYYKNKYFTTVKLLFKLFISSFKSINRFLLLDACLDEQVDFVLLLDH